MPKRLHLAAQPIHVDAQKALRPGAAVSSSLTLSISSRARSSGAHTRHRRSSTSTASQPACRSRAGPAWPAARLGRARTGGWCRDGWFGRVCCMCVALLCGMSWLSGAEVWGSHARVGAVGAEVVVVVSRSLRLLCSVSLPLARVSRIPCMLEWCVRWVCVSYVFECWRAGQSGSVRRQSSQKKYYGSVVVGS